MGDRNALEIQEQLKMIAQICGEGYEARLIISSNVALTHNRRPATVEIGVDIDGSWGPKRTIRAECASITAALSKARERAIRERNYNAGRAVIERAHLLIREALQNSVSLDQAAASIEHDVTRNAVLSAARNLVSGLASAEAAHG